MDIADFFEKVERHADLEGVGIESVKDDNQLWFTVRHKKTCLLTRIPASAVEDGEWAILEEVLTGIREPQVLQHMTRVVGYFSRVENWNKSKIGELHDRQKGNYGIAG